MHKMGFFFLRISFLFSYVYMCMFLFVGKCMCESGDGGVQRGYWVLGVGVRGSYDLPSVNAGS